MKKVLIVALLFLLSLFIGCSKQASSTMVDDRTTISTTQINWDKWGVPHIYAKNNDELFYSFGWAQMHSHANTILKLYGTSRGRAAEYWGAKKAESDMMIHVLGFPTLAETWYEKQTPEFQSYISQFAQGMNDYVMAHPDIIEKQYQVVLPVDKHDILKHALFVLYSRFIGGGDLQDVGDWDDKGSNTYAVAPSRSASGNAMLVMNPHLPWFDEWLFYEGHFNTPDLNLYGATLVGLPTLGIAFNEHMGWSHTNNTIDNADSYELTLKDGGYVVDGEVRQFDAQMGSIKIKQEDGSHVTKDFPIMRSNDHGAVLKQSGNKALSLKMPGYDRPHGIVQWWNMGNATNLNEFKSALKEVQIGFFNIMYADKAGNIFYMFNGQVPVRKTGGWDHWNGVVDGSKSENIWTDIHTYEELPKVENPASGFLQNANDPPWTSTYPRVLDPEDYPPYMAPVVMGFRPQRATKMMVEDESITFDELVEYKMSTKVELADRLLDDLFAAIDAHGGDAAKEAKTVLRNWDRHANADSKGMALFYNWAHTFGVWNRSNYAKDWSLDQAIASPDGLSDPAMAVEKLEKVVNEFKQMKAPLDVAWGDVYRIKYNDKDLPGNGSDGSVGMFRVAWSGGLEDDGTYHIQGGDSWQAVIEFGEQVKAKVTMSYGQSTQKGSPNNGDQLELFSKRQMRVCDFYRADVINNTTRVEKLVEGKFIE